MIEADGSIIASYEKSFLWGREQRYFTPGKREYHCFQSSVGTLGVLICYDIEFPEPSRLLAFDGAQLIVVPSVWGIGAQNRWDIQLPARALDNTVFIAGTNNVGEGACGKSKIVSPNGAVLAEASDHLEEVVIYDIDFDQIQEVRSTIPYLEEFDKDLMPGGGLSH